MASTEPTEVLLGSFRRRFALVVLGGTLAVVTLGWWIAGAAVRPITRIIEQAESIEMGGGGAHEIRARAEVEELRRLVQVLNSMLGRIDAAFESQRRFLSDVGHEIRTPLTVLRGDIEVTLRHSRSRDEYERVLRQTLADLRSTSALADDLLVLARGESRVVEPDWEEVEADTLLDEVAAAYSGGAERRGMSIEVRAVGGVRIHGDRSLLRHALGGLIDNAIRYAGSGESIELACEERGPGEIVLKVVDHGPGVVIAERRRVFERFYRGEAGRKAGSGAGLGLSIAAVVAEGHGGSAGIEETPGGGATVVLRLPGGKDSPP